MTNHYNLTKAHRRGEIIKLCVSCDMMSLDGNEWERYKPLPYYGKYTSTFCPACFAPIQERIKRRST